MNGYSGSVTLSCTAGAPSTCLASAPVIPTTAGAPFAITLGSAVVGTFNFTIQGTDGTLTHATSTVTLTVTTLGADFTWTDTGSTTATILAGESATYTFSAAPIGGGNFISAVNFTCTSLPPLITGSLGAGCMFNPTTISADAPTTSVALTIWTCGPNLPTLCPAGVAGETRPPIAGRPRLLSFFTLAWVLLVGIAAGSIRSKPHLAAKITRTYLGLGLLALLSCGGVGSGTSNPQLVTVTVTPSPATLFANESNLWPAGLTQQQFTATVNGSTDQTVTWQVAPPVGGGSIDDQTGLYSAPTSVPNPATVTVTATSTAALAPGSAFVTVASPTLVGASQVTVTATAAGGASHSDIVTLTVQ